MTKRAKNLIEQTYGNNIQPAIFALVEFAAQNPGLEYGNYGNAQSYRAESRDIGQDWQRFKGALAVAAIEGVTDADVIAEAPHAFSGRLEPVALCQLWAGSDHCKVVQPEMRAMQGYWIEPKDRPATWIDAKVLSFGWNYCTGQYFPTEYRKAAATLIEYATRRVRQARPAQRAERISTIAELKALNAKNGGCWFEPSSMRFFGTRIESGIILGKYFVTSEQPPHGPRNYSVRSFDSEGGVDTVGEFGAYRNKAQAMEAIKAAVQMESAKAA